jgi:hypothetical protein
VGGDTQFLVKGNAPPRRWPASCGSWCCALAPPPALVALLSPKPARVVQEGPQLRARLPAYLVHRRAYLDLRCPRSSLLPGVLLALIYGIEGPATTEELWSTGLGQAP